jgi:AraC-like DNA-binding protein
MTSSIEPTTLIEAMLIEAIRSNEPTKSIETAVGALAAARAPEIAQRTNATRALGSAHSNVNPQSNVTLPGSGDKAEDLGRKAARRGSILTEIARRFCDPKFDLTDAARGLGLSRRYIQRLLEGTGKSFTEHVLECRLQRARAMLMDSRYQHTAIIDIALASGFSDVSHFNHMFRRRFGETPSSVRAAALGALKI